MKIYNYSSDYVYQQKQKNADKESKDEIKTNYKAIDTYEAEPVNYVRDQIQTGGEGEINTTPETENTPKPKSKKKKENREEAKEDYQTDSQVQ